MPMKMKSGRVTRNRRADNVNLIFFNFSAFWTGFQKAGMRKALKHGRLFGPGAGGFPP
jgi:hypothetical protein